MTPTPELRFVERTVEMHPFYKMTNEQGQTVTATQTYRVLQQKWVKQVFNGQGLAHDTDRFEWRDVPLVKEQQ